MDISLLGLFYRVIPLVPLVYTLGVYLWPRPMPRRAFWIAGMSIAIVLTAAVTVIMNSSTQRLAGVGTVAEANACLFIVPMAAMLWVADGLRRRNARRWLGVIVLLAVSYVVNEGAVILWASFFGLVEAKG